MSEFDSPWKDALGYFFPVFLKFFFPDAHEGIDWSRGHESLDKELQQIMHEAELGVRLADKLFKVWLKDGQETWILIHLELQNQRDAIFAERMYIYNYRIYDLHRRRVASLAVLGDDDPHWRPHRFEVSVRRTPSCGPCYHQRHGLGGQNHGAKEVVAGPSQRAVLAEDRPRLAEEWAEHSGVLRRQAAQRTKFLCLASRTRQTRRAEESREADRSSSPRPEAIEAGFIDESVRARTTHVKPFLGPHRDRLIFYPHRACRTRI
jgi:hypothetical protein